MPLRYPLALLLSLLLRQPAAAQSTPCGCPQNLARMVQLIETNYAGYRDKVTLATRPRYDSLTAAVRAQAPTAPDCRALLASWLAFFRDGHLQLSSSEPAAEPPATIRARFAQAERLPWTRATFRAYLDDAARAKQPAEGIWRSGEGTYEVGIVASEPGQYQGFVLRADSIWWVPGQVKLRFRLPADGPGAGTYYMRDHSAESSPATLTQDGALTMHGAWYRTYPRPVAAPTASRPHSFQMLDDTTALYRIASFDGRYRPLLDSLTRAHAADLRRTRLLILDLRGNGGGSDGSYRSLAPYLYTGPVRLVGVALWSTPENNKKYEAAQFPNMSLAEKVYFARLKRRLDGQPNQFVRQRKRSPVTTRRLARRRQHPEVRRVAILQDRGCGSTTEQFLLLAQQSQKVTRFGENSAGVLDYANMWFAPLPCGGLRLGWATSRSYRLDRGEGIDNVGLMPNVRLAAPAAPSAVEEVRAWYRKH